MVLSSDLPEMDFVSMSVIHKHYVCCRRFFICGQGLIYAQVHFAVPEGNYGKTVIYAQNQDTNNIFKLIPREKIQNDLPKLLIEGHVHWLNLSTSVIEIRPIGEPWEQTSSNWMIPLQPGPSCVTKGCQLLVDKRSPTWKMVSSRLRCLEDPENLIITTPPVDAILPLASLPLSITLPRYCLSFFINEVNDLESRDFKNMIYDEDQCIGTLFGLVDRIVLRPKFQPEADLIPKVILVPHGRFHDAHGDYIRVAPPFSGPVRYYTYQVDVELSRLQGSVSLESRVYLARLHALTGHGCRPDPLTGRTGVEEAISLIWLAGTRQEAPAPHGSWYSGLPSHQMRFAISKIGIQPENDNHNLPSEDVLRREAYLFPSEITASTQKEPLGSLHQLLHERPAPNLPRRDELPPYNLGFHNLSSPDTYPLRQLFSSLQANETAPAFQSQYISRLHNSAHHLQTSDPITCHGGIKKPGIATLRKHYVQCRITYTESLNIIKRSLGPQTEFEQILAQCGHWPRGTPFTLFRCLASTSPIKPPESWKKCLIHLALLALDVQRARRLLRFALDDLEEELYKELENEGCDGWDPTEHPDWLLIQVCLLRHGHLFFLIARLYPISAARQLPHSSCPGRRC